MIVGFAFASNAIFNFLAGLLVAKFLGPIEFGRFAIASAIAVMINTAGFEWIRLSAVRFYSQRTRQERPEIRATLDDCVALLAFAVSLLVLAVTLSGVDLALSPGLLATAAAAGVASGFYDYSTALARARFLDKTHTGIIIGKNVFGLVLTVGGAWWFGSAALALAGVALSVAGALIAAGRPLLDPGAGLGQGRWALAKQFMRYGLPFVGASILFQVIPLANRALVSGLFGFGETGQFSLANDIGVRVLAAIASTLDILIFQLAVRAEETHGVHRARAQLAENMTIVLAIVLPAGVGMWLVLPSFEALVVPEAFRGPFARYLSTMLPGLVAFVLLQYAISPIFQIARRTWPMIIVALSACGADGLLILLWARGGDAHSFALAQSLAQIVGLCVAIGYAAALRPLWPALRDIGAPIAATGVLALVVLPLRDRAPGLALLIAQVGVGAFVYGALAYLLDIARARSRLAGALGGSRAEALLRRRPSPDQGTAAKAARRLKS
jgi:O-antigen/teichoic acid export membrane protein